MATATTGTVKGRKPAAPCEAVTPTEAGPRPYRMTVDVYEAIVEAGVFGDTSPVFPRRGQLVLPVSKGRNDHFAQAGLNMILLRLATGGWHVRAGSPVRLPDDSEPEPDFTIIRGRPRDYLGRTPCPADVALVVEVADSSLGYDSGDKLAAYAEAGIPVYWVVNIPGKRIDVYSRPSGPTAAPTYEVHQSYGPNDEVPVALDGREVGRVPVREVLP